MPLIQSIEYSAANGGSVRVVCTDPSIGNQGVVTASRNDLPGNLRNSTDTVAIQNFINNFLRTALTFVDGDGVTTWRVYVAVHVWSNTGGVLSMTHVAANSPEEVPADWWVST